jgi:hypothetical protein
LRGGIRSRFDRRKAQRLRLDGAAALDPSAAAPEFIGVESVNSRKMSKMCGLARAVASGRAGFKREAGGADRADACVRLSKPIDFRHRNHVSPHQPRALFGLR